MCKAREQKAGFSARHSLSGEDTRRKLRLKQLSPQYHNQYSDVFTFGTHYTLPQVVHVPVSHNGEAQAFLKSHLTEMQQMHVSSVISIAKGVYTVLGFKMEKANIK